MPLTPSHHFIMEGPLSLSEQTSHEAQQNDGISVRLCLYASPAHVRKIRRLKIGFAVRLASRMVVEIFELYLYRDRQKSASQVW